MATKRKPSATKKSSSPVQKKKQKTDQSSIKKVVAAGMIGNGLEWYDYALYGHFATLISSHFFPSDNPDNQYLSLIATFGVFAAGFIMRPLGAVLFGYIGDAYGRRSALAISILLMAFPTAMIGLLPTYAQIGIWAPLLLTLFRLLQGLALGGEFSGSITYVVEHAPAGKRGIIGGTSLVSMMIGILLGAFVGTAFSKGLSPEDFQSWGWRVPFVIGLVIGLIGFYIRSFLDESPAYKKAKERSALSDTPVRDTLRSHGGTLLMTIMIYIGVTAPFYVYTVFMNTYMSKILSYSFSDSMLVTTVSMLLVTLLIPVAAGISDRIGRKPVMVFSALAYMLLSYPIFMLIESGSLAYAQLGMIMYGIVLTFYIAPVPAMLVEVFPTRVRYTGMALACNISAAVFGGTTPMIVTSLIQATGNPSVVAFYVMASLALSLVALYFYKETYKANIHPAKDD